MSQAVSYISTLKFLWTKPLIIGTLQSAGTTFVTFKQVSLINVVPYNVFAMAVNAAALAIAYGVVQLVTVLVSIFRLWFRLKIGRFWWEDAWAAVATVCTLAYATTDLISSHASSSETAEFNHWMSFIFTTIVWSIRMSLLYSIIRIILPSTFLRNLARAIGVLFVALWAMIIFLKIWWCVALSTCHVSSQVAIFEVAVDFAGDATLVVLSLKLLWRVKLPRRQRRMILSIFSCSAVMSTTSLPRTIAEILPDEVLQSIFADLQLIASLAVCNMLVVVTYVYRVCLSSSESGSSSEDDDFTTPAPRSPQTLTTVDLDASDPTTTEATNDF